MPTLVWVLMFHFATGAVRLTPGFLNPHPRSPRPCGKPLRPLLALSPVWLKLSRRGTAVPKLLVLPLSLLGLLPVTSVLKDPRVLSLLPALLLPLQLTGLPSLVFCDGLSASTACEQQLRHGETAALTLAQLRHWRAFLGLQTLPSNQGEAVQIAMAVVTREAQRLQREATKRWRHRFSESTAAAVQAGASSLKLSEPPDPNLSSDKRLGAGVDSASL